VKTENNNLIRNVPYGSIEGVWTFVYFSYTNRVSKAVGFIQYGGGDI
jgi:hypothetical protein